MNTDSQAYALVLGQVIAALRTRHKPSMTQSELAAKVRVAQATISRIEAGRAVPDIVTFNAIAAALNVERSTLDRYVEDGLERMRRAAASAGAAPQANESWWKGALKLAGVVGLAGLAAFAVAALLSEEE